MPRLGKKKENKNQQINITSWKWHKFTSYEDLFFKVLIQKETR